MVYGMRVMLAVCLLEGCSSCVNYMTVSRASSLAVNVVYTETQCGSISSNRIELI